MVSHGLLMLFLCVSQPSSAKLLFTGKWLIQRPTTVQGAEIGDFSTLSLKRDHHITSPTAMAYGSLEKSGGEPKDSERQRWWVPTRKLCIPDTTGWLHTWIFSSWKQHAWDLHKLKPAKSPHGGGGGLEVPELRSYWQLITTGRDRVSFLYGWSCWWVSHAPVEDQIPKST